ncbi:unnamed protein product [Staurois parvus]|uniref:Uncharacterized protein n=1 Tax=Staurois parvus TaxID=386267 RepID=A0ABN9C253_9NEOB|nr:unnamed protein product [Staurois parvus]
MNGGQRFSDPQDLYMREEYFFWISRFLLIILLSHQRLRSAPESITVISTAKE